VWRSRLRSACVNTGKRTGYGTCATRQCGFCRRPAPSMVVQSGRRIRRATHDRRLRGWRPAVLLWRSEARTTSVPAAERAMAEKRADYFAAGTLVVWDVDTLKDHVVRAYRASDSRESRDLSSRRTRRTPSPRFPAGRWRSMICFRNNDSRGRISTFRRRLRCRNIENSACGKTAVRGCRRTCTANSALAAVSCWRLGRTGSRRSSSSRRPGACKSPRIPRPSRTFNSGWLKRGST
jgi:hypothetical protein